MKPEVFLNQLQQLAELKEIRPPMESGRREATEPEQIIRGLESFEISKHENKTWAYAVKKITHSVPCPDCGKKNAKGRVVNIRLCEYPKPHWSKSCNICKQHYNPLTGEFDATVHQASNCWVSFFKKDK